MNVIKTGVLQHASVQAFCASWFIVLAIQMAVPLYPIPMTIQRFAIALVALLATRRTAACAVLLYLTYGVIGAFIGKWHWRTKSTYEPYGRLFIRLCLDK